MIFSRNESASWVAPPLRSEPSLDGYSGLALAASPTGVTGKVTAIVYDRFGDFEAFLLELPHGGERRSRSRETRVEAVIREAWTDRIITPLSRSRTTPRASDS
jgi:hypothetical protein